MTRDQFRIIYLETLGYDHKRNFFWRDHKDSIVQATSYEELEKFIMNNCEPYAPRLPSNTPPIFLGNCTTATTPVCYSLDCIPPAAQQEQGNNPMRVEYNTPTASASVINAKSDEAYQREYLLTELGRFTEYSFRDHKYTVLRGLFNIDAPVYPRTSQELLDALKNGKFVVDQKKVDSNTKYWASREADEDFDEDYDGQAERFYGITFTDLPVADREGYDAALKAYEKAKTDTKRKIIVSSPTDGLQALLDLEAWMPAGKAN